MAYIGNVPAEKYTALTQQTFSSPTGTSFTLSQAVTNSVDIDLYIDNVKQNPASYSVSGTALTTSTISSPSTMYCIFNGRTTETVNPPDDSVGLSQIASGTDGNLITFDASGNPAYVATGNDGQVLTSAGAGQPCLFEDAGGGRMTLLSTASPSGASSADMTTGISDTYDSYFLEVVNLVCATDDVQLYVRLSSDGGSSFLTTTSYEWRFLYNYDGTARGSYDTNNNHWTVFLHSDNGASTSSGSLGITLQGIRQTTLYPTFHGTGVTHNASGVLQSQFLAGEFKVAGTKYNGIQVLAASGNITGTVRLYGIS